MVRTNWKFISLIAIVLVASMLALPEYLRINKMKETCR